MKANSVKISPEVKSLFAAIERKDLRRVRQLVERGVPVDSKNKDGWTALLVATRDSRTNIALFLIEQGANVNAKVPQSDYDCSFRDASVLMAASVRGNLPLVEMLLGRGANLEEKSFGCATAVVLAAINGHEQVAYRLLAGGALVPENTWKWCLFQAARQNRPELLQALLDRSGAAPEQLGWLLPASVGSLACVRLLLERGLDINAGSSDGETALMRAVSWEHLEVVELLLQSGADESIRVNGRDALIIARRASSYRAMTLLKNAAKLRAAAGVEVKRAGPPVPPPKVKPAKPAKGSKRKPIARQAATSEGGVGAFVDLMSTSQPEWSLYAVEAEFDTVAAAVRKQLNLRERWPGVALVKPVKKFTVVPPLVTLVQLRGSAWTVVFKSLFDYQEPVEPEAQALSAALQTQVVTFSGEDTASAMGYQLFADGELVEQADWEEGGEVHFHSNRGRKLKQKTGDRSIAETVFKELGILIPACYPRAQGDGFALVVIAPAPEEFAHVELLGWP